MNYTTAIKHLTGDDVDKARSAALAVRGDLWQAANGDLRKLPKKAHDALDAVIDADIYDAEFPRFWPPSLRGGYHQLVEMCVDRQEVDDDDVAG